MLIRKSALAAALFLAIITLGGWINSQVQASRTKQFQSVRPYGIYRAGSQSNMDAAQTTPIPFRPREYIRMIQMDQEP